MYSLRLGLRELSRGVFGLPVNREQGGVDGAAAHGVAAGRSAGRGVSLGWGDGTESEALMRLKMSSAMHLVTSLDSTC